MTDEEKILDWRPILQKEGKRLLENQIKRDNEWYDWFEGVLRRLDSENND